LDLLLFTHEAGSFVPCLFKLGSILILAKVVQEIFLLEGSDFFVDSVPRSPETLAEFLCGVV
jgi:hypothetical protein